MLISVIREIAYLYKSMYYKDLAIPGWGGGGKWEGGGRGASDQKGFTKKHI